MNEGSHFAPLRQVYHSLVLAKWYRENLADKGIHTSLRELSERIWHEVLDGEFANLIWPHLKGF